MSERENTLFLDYTGKPLYVGDIVRVYIKHPFNMTHGNWADYEIAKCPGGYMLVYFRSEKGCLLPWGYTSQFMYAMDSEDAAMPDLKTVLFTAAPVKHPLLKKVECAMTQDERRELFMMESRKRREALK
jgi:hypothetical protein